MLKGLVYSVGLVYLLKRTIKTSISTSIFQEKKDKHVKTHRMGSYFDWLDTFTENKVLTRFYHTKTVPVSLVCKEGRNPLLRSLVVEVSWKS